MYRSESTGLCYMVNTEQKKSALQDIAGCCSATSNTPTRKFGWYKRISLWLAQYLDQYMPKSEC